MERAISLIQIWSPQASRNLCDTLGMNVTQLFPTPVADFSLGRDFTEAELNFIIKDAERRPNGFNETSVNGYILESPELAGLKDFVLKCAEEYARQVWRVQDSCGLRLTQSWVNYTKPGESHHRHIHANSLYSGVMYVATDNARDKIHFYRHEPSTLRPDYAEYNMFNTESWWLPADTGSMVIFPSTLEHAVTQVGDGIERCSLAFNFFPCGVIGNFGALTEARI